MEKKCFHCKKKTCVLSHCKCGNHYCLEHRYPEKHACQFDHKEFHKNELVKNNPVITSHKITKITSS